MPTINVFIISWAGKHENAVHIANQVLEVTNDVTIVYSDPDESWQLDAPCPTIRRPNDLFWGDKFKTCIDACGDNALLIIHADCTYWNWGHLALRCANVVNANPLFGVWAPRIDYVPWPLEGVIIADLDDGQLAVTSRTDGIVFYLAAPIVERMRKANYDKNVFGRGIEMVFAAATFARGLLCIVDKSITVTHPKETGYSELEAHHQLNEFLKQMDLREHMQHIMLKAVYLSKGVRPVDPRLDAQDTATHDSASNA